MKVKSSTKWSWSVSLYEQMKCWEWNLAGGCSPLSWTWRSSVLVELCALRLRLWTYFYIEWVGFHSWVVCRSEPRLSSLPAGLNPPDSGHINASPHGEQLGSVGVRPHGSEMWTHTRWVWFTRFQMLKLIILCWYLMKLSRLVDYMFDFQTYCDVQWCSGKVCNTIWWKLSFF